MNFGRFAEWATLMYKYCNTILSTIATYEPILYYICSKSSVISVLPVFWFYRFQMHMEVYFNM